MIVSKVLFVQSSFYSDDGRLVRANGLLDRLSTVNVAELGIPLLAAYTPPGIQVEMVDDALESIPWDTTAEVVAISAKLIQRKRALDLAAAFQRRGKVVVLGGFLASLHPEGLEGRFAAICIGDGDQVWPQMIEDMQNDRLRKVYRADHAVDLHSVPVPRYDLLAEKSRLLGIRTSYPVQATRGCPHSCSYCCITRFYGQTYRYRPIDQIVRDIRAHGSRLMHFVDDNLMVNRAFAKELFRNMVGLDVLWGTQTSIDIARDDELLELAYRAGCRVVMVGMESTSQRNLEAVNKGWGGAGSYRDAIRTIQGKGIAVHALIILGLPHDTQKSIDGTVDFLVDAGAAAAEFFIFTPYPGTPAGEEYRRQGRIVDFDPTHYREPFVVFQHAHLSARELQRGFWRSLSRFYSFRNIYRRLCRSGLPSKKLPLVLNLLYWWKIRRSIVPTHFQRGNYLTMSFPEASREVGNSRDPGPSGFPLDGQDPGGAATPPEASHVPSSS